MKLNPNEVVKFLRRCGNGLYDDYDDDFLSEVIRLHILYKTFMVIRDKKGIVAIARWNFLTPETVHILDVVVRKDYRKPTILRQMLAAGINKNPSVTHICFERYKKYPDRMNRIYRVDDLLKRRKR